MQQIVRFLVDFVTRRGIKQAFIAEKTGLSADVISKIFKGERRLQADEFLRICKAVNIPDEEIKQLIADINNP